MDFNELDYQQFDFFVAVCLLLKSLRRFAFALKGGPDKGIDWIFITPNGKRGIAAVKHIRTPMSSFIHRAATYLYNGIALTNADKAYLMLSIPLPERLQKILIYEEPSIEVWDSETIHSLLDKHKEVL